MIYSFWRFVCYSVLVLHVHLNCCFCSQTQPIGDIESQDVSTSYPAVVPRNPNDNSLNLESLTPDTPNLSCPPLCNQYPQGQIPNNQVTSNQVTSNQLTRSLDSSTALSVNHNTQFYKDLLADSEYSPPVYQNCCLVYYAQGSATFWYIANDYFGVGSITLQAVAIGLSSLDQFIWGGYTKGFQLGAIICGSMHVYATKRSRVASQQAVDLKELRSKAKKAKKDKKDKKKRKAAEAAPVRNPGEAIV